MTDPIYIAVGRRSMSTRPYIRIYTSIGAWGADRKEAHYMEAYPYSRAAELIEQLPAIDWLTSDEVLALRDQYDLLVTLRQP